MNIEEKMPIHPYLYAHTHFKSNIYIYLLYNISKLRYIPQKASWKKNYFIINVSDNYHLFLMLCDKKIFVCVDTQIGLHRGFKEIISNPLTRIKNKASLNRNISQIIMNDKEKKIEIV